MGPKRANSLECVWHDRQMMHLWEDQANANVALTSSILNRYRDSNWSVTQRDVRGPDEIQNQAAMRREEAQGQWLDIWDSLLEQFPTNLFFFFYLLLSDGIYCFQIVFYFGYPQCASDRLTQVNSILSFCIKLEQAFVHLVFPYKGAVPL